MCDILCACASVKEGLVIQRGTTQGTFGIKAYHLRDLCKTVAMDLLCEADELFLLLSPWPLQ